MHRDAAGCDAQRQHPQAAPRPRGRLQQPQDAVRRGRHQQTPALIAHLMEPQPSGARRLVEIFCHNIVRAYWFCCPGKTLPRPCQQP